MLNPMNFMMELQKFASGLQGDPKQQVEQLMKTGQMSQETYSQYSKVAEMIDGGNHQNALKIIFGQ